MGKDHTLYALVEGNVSYKREEFRIPRPFRNFRVKKWIHVIPKVKIPKFVLNTS